MVADLAQNRALLYDKTGEEHYNLISALHKSMRNSDPDAAVYWLARMLEAARTRSTSRGGWCASRRRTSATPIRRRSPSRWPPRRPCTSSACPKATPRWRRRRSTWRPRRRATPSTAPTPRPPRRPPRDVAEPVPLHLRNAPTRLMKALDYGKGYRYAHDEPEGVADMECLPPAHRRPAVLPADRARVRSGDEEEAGGTARETQERRGLKAPAYELGERSARLGSGAEAHRRATRPSRRERDDAGSRPGRASRQSLKCGIFLNISCRSGRMNEKR